MVKSHEPTNKLDESHWVIKKTKQQEQKPPRNLYAEGTSWGDEWELREWEGEGNRSD